MDIGVGIASAPSMVKADDSIRKPAAAFDVFAVVVIVSRDRIRAQRIEDKNRQFFQQGRGDGFVRVESEDPVVRSKGGRLVAQRTNSNEGPLLDFDIGKAAHQKKRFIGRAIVEKNHFRKKSNRSERCLDCLCRIFCKNADRNHLGEHTKLFS